MIHPHISDLKSAPFRVVSDAAKSLGHRESVAHLQLLSCYIDIEALRATVANVRRHFPRLQTVSLMFEYMELYRPLQRGELRNELEQLKAELQPSPA